MVIIQSPGPLLATDLQLDRYNIADGNNLTMQAKDCMLVIIQVQDLYNTEEFLEDRKHSKSGLL